MYKEYVVKFSPHKYAGRWGPTRRGKIVVTDESCGIYGRCVNSWLVSVFGTFFMLLGVTIILMMGGATIDWSKNDPLFSLLIMTALAWGLRHRGPKLSLTVPWSRVEIMKSAPPLLTMGQIVLRAIGILILGFGCAANYNITTGSAFVWGVIPAFVYVCRHLRHRNECRMGLLVRVPKSSWLREEHVLPVVVSAVASGKHMAEPMALQELIRQMKEGTKEEEPQSYQETPDTVPLLASEDVIGAAPRYGYQSALLAKLRSLGDEAAEGGACRGEEAQTPQVAVAKSRSSSGTVEPSAAHSPVNDGRTTRSDRPSDTAFLKKGKSKPKPKRIALLMGITTFLAVVFVSRPYVPQGIEVMRGRLVPHFRPDTSSLVLDLGEGVEMEFVWIETLEGWVGKYEATNRQYRRFNRAHSSGNYNGFDLDGDDQPVVSVGWHEATAYCQWLEKNHIHRKETGIPKRYRARLLTNDEWLMLARCGENRRYPWGKSMPPIRGNYDDETIIDQAKIDGYVDGSVVSCPVEQSGANEWGLFGVGGNVQEWAGSDDGSTGIVVDASWRDQERHCLLCGTGYTISDQKSDDVGFRLCIMP